MRQIKIGEILYTRTEEPTPILVGTWESASLLQDPSDRVPMEVERDLAEALDRLAHIEDALISKHRELIFMAADLRCLIP